MNDRTDRSTQSPLTDPSPSPHPHPHPAPPDPPHPPPTAPRQSPIPNPQPPVATATATTQWFAIWTRSRHEQAVRQQLERKQFEAFLPTITKWSRWKDRKKKID